MHTPAVVVTVSPPSGPRYFIHEDQLSLFTSSKTFNEARQLHGFHLKAGTFHHPSVSSRLLSRYTAPEINDLYYARSVFDRIHDPSLVLWNMMIKCYVENHRAHEAISLFRDLVLEFPPDNFTLPCVLKGCSRLNAVEEGKQIHGFSLKLGLALDKFVQSSLLSMYSKCDSIDCARKVFDQMEERDLVSWNSLIDGYARSGQVEVAVKLFDEMPERDSFSYTSLLSGFSKCGKIEAAREIFAQMPTKSIISWNVMINGYMKSGDPESARRLFNRMPTRDVVTWNSIISGYGVNGRFKEALRMFIRMSEEDFTPNNATLASLISAVSNSAILILGRWVHSYIVKNGIELEGVIGTLLIEMHSKCGSIENALSVFKAICRKKLGHWSSIIAGLGMHGMADNAIELFNEMRESGIEPNDVTFVGLLNACSHAGYVEKACTYFALLRDEYGIEHSLEHYGCLVDALCRTGHLKEAKSIIDTMPKKPNKVIWMSLLHGAKIYGKTEIGEFAAQRLIELAPEISGSYVLLSNLYAAAGKWENVSKIREMMKNIGVMKEAGWSLIEQDGEIHRFMVGDDSHPHMQEIYATMKDLSEKLREAGHIPDTTRVMSYMEGVREKEAELEMYSEDWLNVYS